MYLGSPIINNKTLINSLGGVSNFIADKVFQAAKWSFTFRFSLVKTKDVIPLKNWHVILI